MPVPPGTEDTFGAWPGDTTDTGGGGGEPTTEVIVTAGIPFWRDEPRSWDRVVIAGVELPGVCDVDAELRRKLDKKNPKGIDGATITDDGEDQTPIEIQVKITTREDWTKFQSIVPYINPKGSGKKVAVSVDYPTLALFGVNRVYIEAVRVPKFGPRRQYVTVSIRASEWRPPPKAAKSSKSSTTDESVDGAREAKRATSQNDLVEEGEADGTAKLAGDGWSGDDDYEMDTDP